MAARAHWFTDEAPEGEEAVEAVAEDASEEQA